MVGDIRQGGEDYAERLLGAMERRGSRGPIVLELFRPADDMFFKRVSKAISHFNIQMSPESHDEEVRQAFGKGWRDVDIENTVKSALENGCKRFDLFYMIGLPKQDYPVFPEIKEDKKIEMQKSILQEMIQKTSFSMSTDETRYQLNGIYFTCKGKKVRMVATDGRRLSYIERELKDEKNDFSVIIPRKAVVELVHLHL